MVCKRRWPRLPAAFLVVVVVTLAVYVFKLKTAGIHTVESVPRGFPPLALPALSWPLIRQLWPGALTLCLVGTMESIAVAKHIATRAGYRVHPDREFSGLGLSNLVAGLFSGYPVTGGFSRSAVNYEAGARTPVASLVTAVLVGLTLWFLTPLFYYLPHAVLGAVILVAVAGLIDFSEVRRLWQRKRMDAVTLLLTFITTLLLGIETGILLGIAFSLALFIRRSAHPHTAVLGYVDNPGVFRNIARYPEAQTFPGIVLLRVDASLYFANTRFLEDRVAAVLEEYPDTRQLILDLSGVNDIDAAGQNLLERLAETYRERGVSLELAAVKGPVRDLMTRGQRNDPPSWYRVYPSLSQALQEKGTDPSSTDLKASHQETLV
jgi:SulP family sulfate permease